MTVFEKIESAARTAYKSEPQGDPRGFCDKLWKAGHFPVFEFANFHVKLLSEDMKEEAAGGYRYLDVSYDPVDGKAILSGTLRAFIEEFPGTKDSYVDPYVSNMFWESGFTPGKPPVPGSSFHHGIVKFVSEPGHKDNKMCAVKFVVNRAVSHELVRHRAQSIIQESQRFCAYNKDRFNNEVTFIDPQPFFQKGSEGYNLWESSCLLAEYTYLQMLKNGSSPQAARTVLPNSCKTELILFATITEWKHIFKLRTSPAAEPSMREVMIPLQEEFFNHKDLWE